MVSYMECLLMLFHVFLTLIRALPSQLSLVWKSIYEILYSLWRLKLVLFGKVQGTLFWSCHGASLYGISSWYIGMSSYNGLYDMEGYQSKLDFIDLVMWWMCNVLFVFDETEIIDHMILMCPYSGHILKHVFLFAFSWHQCPILPLDWFSLLR